MIYIRSISADDREILCILPLSPIRILISKRKNPRDSITKHRTNFSISLDSPIDCFHSRRSLHICFYTRKCSPSMDYNGPFSFLTHSRSRRNRSPFYRQEENFTFSCFLFTNVHDISQPWMDSLYLFTDDISNLVQRICSLFNLVENREHNRHSICIHPCFGDTRLLE